MKTYTIRDIPEELFERFKRLAQRERRSIKEEMIEVMDRAVQQDMLRQPQQTAPPPIAELPRTPPVETQVREDPLAVLGISRCRR